VVRAALADLGGRAVVLAECDPSVRKGALSAADGATLAAAADHAIEAQRPLVVLIASSGADVTEGLAASAGWGRARVP
jgi:acetyl-CoA carboxylase beta subunit